MTTNPRRTRNPSKQRKKWANRTLLLLCLFKSISLYFMFQQQFNFTPRTSCVLSILLGALFTAISCASIGFQCITLLMVPQMLSKRGRTALIAYVFVLAISGPARNAVDNIEVMLQSLNCVQAQLKVSIHETLKTIAVPFVAIKDTIQTVVAEVSRGFMEIQRVLEDIMKGVQTTVESIRAGYQWLAELVSFCNKDGKTSFERCIATLETSVADCRRKLRFLGFMCNVKSAGRTICYSSKIIDWFCELISFVDDAVIDAIEANLKQFVDGMLVMFQVSVDFDHGYYYNMNISKTFEEIAEDITQEVQNQTIFKMFNFLGIISSLCMFFVILRSIRYKTNYLSSDDYDNCYIGHEFYAVDRRREAMQLPRALPLTRREQNCYITLTSLYLLRRERLRIARNAFFLFISTIQIASIVSADYCLYWLLAIISQAFQKQAEIKLPSMIKIKVIGKGAIAEMYRNVVSAIEAGAKMADYLQPAKCAPYPKMPNFVRYYQIGFLLVSAWAFIVLEPYGLRVRQLIMAGYYPDRARERATWLYNDILLKRETFVKLVLKQMESDLDDPYRTPTCLDLIRAKTNHYWISRLVLGSHHPVRCILCGTDLARDDYVRCYRPRCSGKYCYECFLEIQHVCWMCGDPISTGDSSDESLERDSSEEA